MSELKRVLIIAGGTGGHVFPGLALANYFREQGVEVHWMGTQAGIEARLVPEAKIPLHLVDIAGIRGKGIKPLLLAPIRITKAIFQSLSIISKVNPDIVIGMGGFVGGPGGVAAWLKRKPLVIHEQNAKPGTTNKILSKIATKVLMGFPETFKSNSNVINVGNPVRAEIENLPPPDVRLSTPHTPFRLLVLGGSLGAQALNEMVPKALGKMNLENRPEVMHQTGEKFFDTAKKCYESLGVQANLIPFVKDMAHAYAWADMVICRAGALTVAELCAVGLGAIFVPFPFAIDDHQTANANFMVKHDAALCIQQSELTESRLADIVGEFSRSPEKRLEMANAAFHLRQVNVAKTIYQLCKEMRP